jgi:hypothetical protein
VLVFPLLSSSKPRRRPVFVFSRSRVHLCAHLAFEQIFRPRASKRRPVVSLCAPADFRSGPHYLFCIYSPADFCRRFGLSGHCSWIFSALRLSPVDFPAALPLGPRRSCFSRSGTLTAPRSDQECPVSRYRLVFGPASAAPIFGSCAVF